MNWLKGDDCRDHNRDHGHQDLPKPATPASVRLRGRGTDLRGGVADDLARIIRGEGVDVVVQVGDFVGDGQDLTDPEVARAGGAGGAGGAVGATDGLAAAAGPGG